MLARQDENKFNSDTWLRLVIIIGFIDLNISGFDWKITNNNKPLLTSSKI